MSKMIKLMQNYTEKHYSDSLKEKSKEFIDKYLERVNGFDEELTKIKTESNWYLLNDLEEKYEVCLEDFKRDPEHINYLLHQNLFKVAT